MKIQVGNLSPPVIISKKKKKEISCFLNEERRPWDGVPEFIKQEQCYMY